MRTREAKAASVEGRDWDGHRLTVCAVCGYAVTDAAKAAEHARISGHAMELIPENVSGKNDRGSDEFPAIENNEVNQ